MATLTEDEKTDLNPGQKHADGQFGSHDKIEGYDRSKDGLDAIDPFRTQAKELKARESDSTNTFTGSSSEKVSDAERNFHVSNYTGGTLSVVPGKRKKGPIGVIIGILLTGGIIGGGLLSPGFGLVHMKEALTSDLNDLLGASDVRTGRLLVSKVGGIGGSSVACKLAIKCKFTTMSGSSVKKFQNAGFIIDCKDGCKEGRFSRNKITSMAFKRPSTGEIVQIKDPNHFKSLLLLDKELKDGTYKAFRPKTAMLRNATSSKVLRSFFTDRLSKISGSTEEERSRSVKNATAGINTNLEDTRVSTVLDEEGRSVVVDAEGKNLAASETARIIAAEEELISAKTALSGGSLSTKALGGAASTIGVTAYLDDICSGYRTMRLVNSSVKWLRQLQLAQFAMVGLTLADKIKAGDATPEEVEYVMTRATAIDTRSEVSADLIEGEDPVVFDNPDLGKDAYGSEGMRAALYNEAPEPGINAQKFVLGGGIFSVAISAIDTLTGGSAQATCGFITNPITRVVSTVGGVVLAVFSGGSSAGATVGIKQAITQGVKLSVKSIFSKGGLAQLVKGGSPHLVAAIGIFMAARYLPEILAGETVGPATKGAEWGNGTFVGTSAILGGAAMAHGMTPGTSESIKKYTVVQNEAKQKDIAFETEQAKSEPFNINNPYSFLGSFASKLYPTTNSATRNVASFISSASSTVASGFGSIFSDKALAKNAFNPERFNKCDDIDYKELGIDADIFCNVRYVMSDEELNMDPEKVLDYMLAAGYIDSEGNAVAGSDYAKWITNCTERFKGWGVDDEDDGGASCFSTSEKTPNTASLVAVADSSQQKLNNFRVYTMDKSISDTMDGIDGEEGTTELEDGYITDIPSGTAKDLASQIIATGKVKDRTSQSQLSRIARGLTPIQGSSRSVDPKILGVILALAQQGNTFSVSSLLRNYIPTNGSTTSQHLVGKAIDISGSAGINGEAFTYGGHSQNIQTFINQAAALLPSGCEIGVPNQTYVNNTRPLVKSGCNVFIDKGTGAHIHLGL